MIKLGSKMFSLECSGTICFLIKRNTLVHGQEERNMAPGPTSEDGGQRGIPGYATASVAKFHDNQL